MVTKEFMSAILSGWNDTEQMGVFTIGEGTCKEDCRLIFGADADDNLLPSGDYIYSYCNRVMTGIGGGTIEEFKSLTDNNGDTIYIYQL